MDVAGRYGWANIVRLVETLQVDLYRSSRQYRISWLELRKLGGLGWCRGYRSLMICLRGGLRTDRFHWMMMVSRCGLQVEGLIS